MKLMMLLHDRLSPEEQDADVLGPVDGMVERLTRFHPGLLACADARIGFEPQVNEPLIQTFGSVNKRSLAGPWGSKGADGVYGSSIEGSPVRIERTVDPEDSGRRCWWLRCHADDPDTAGPGAKRTEFTYSKTPSRLMPGRRYVIGLGLRLADWRASRDGQLVWQIHQADSIGGPPWLGCYVYGRDMYVYARFNPEANPTSATNKNIGRLWTDAEWAPNRWYRCVIDVLEDYRGNGIANIWMNGTQVVAYRGPLGCNEEAAGGAYFKSGIYHWTNSGNTWDRSLPVREGWFKGAYIAPGGVVMPESMDAFLKAI